MDKQAALELINRKLKQAQDLMDECVFIAEGASVVFHLPWGGEGTAQRGMGASYYPTTLTEEDRKYHYVDEWETGWQPSAGSC